MPDFGNTSVFSQTDANNNTGTQPSWSGSAAPSTLDNAGRALQGAAFREWNWRNFTVSTTGSSNAYVVTYSVAPAALYNGQRFGFITNFANTDTATLNINSLGAKTIKKVVAGVKTALASGDIASGAFVEVAYNTSDDSFLWVNRGEIPSSYYSPGGTDVALADGGTGASLTDPNADRIMFWDDSGSAVTWLTVGSGLAISGTTMSVDINGLTEDTSPDLSNDFVMTYDTSAGGLKKVKPNNLEPASTNSGCDIIVENVSLSGSSVTWNNTVITRTYKAFKVLIRGGSLNATGVITLLISGDNGTGTATAASFSMASAGATVSAEVDIGSANLASGTRLSSIKSNNGGTVAFDVNNPSITTGVINWMRVSGGSDTLDAGTVTIIGYY